MQTNKYLGFLDDIKHLDWTITPGGTIRTSKNECPICAYVNVKLGTAYSINVLSALYQYQPEITPAEIFDLGHFLEAADNMGSSELRAQILARLNLTEYAG
jgi:hypothetical protein